MSWQASQYARFALEQPELELTVGARLVLMLLAERADRTTGDSWPGPWLSAAAGMHPNSVRRSIRELAGAGLVAHVNPGAGRTARVRFPATSGISTTRADGRGSEQATRADGRGVAPTGAQTRADGRGIPVTEPVSTTAAGDEQIRPDIAARIARAIANGTGHTFDVA